jgi:hypothetical protein
MLVVVVLLPLSSPMTVSSTTVVAVAVVAGVEAVEDNLSVKAAGNESVDGRMPACVHFADHFDGHHGVPVLYCVHRPMKEVNGFRKSR